MLLQMFAAVVVGGTTLGGGRGGPLGTVFGAYILMMVVNILLVLNVSAYYSTVAEGYDPDPRRARRLASAGIRRSPATSGMSSCGSGARAQGPLPTQRRPRRPTSALARARRSERRAPSERDSGVFVAQRRNAALRRCPPTSASPSSLSSTAVRPRPRADKLVLFQLADRALLVPGGARARAGNGDPYRRPRPLRSLDHRPERHPARGHGQGIGRRAGLCACRSRCSSGSSLVSSTAPGSSCSAFRRS